MEICSRLERQCISDREKKPFMMHGNYGADVRVTQLVDTTNLWLMLTLHTVFKMGLQGFGNIASGWRWLYKKLAPSIGSLEITLSLSQLLQLLTTSPILLEPVPGPVSYTMFQVQVCYPPDYTKLSTVKIHYDILRCYDTMMRHFPALLVSGVFIKVDSGRRG